LGEKLKSYKIIQMEGKLLVTLALALLASTGVYI
jgi:hypothetical protein